MRATKFFPRNRAQRIQTNASVQGARPRLLRSLGIVAELLSHGRTIVLNLLLLVISVTIAWLIYHETQLQVVSINSFQVPEALSKHGYSSEVVSNRIGFRLQETNENSGTEMKRKALAMQGSQIDVQIPGSGIGYRTVVRLAKEIFQISDYTVTGDLVESDDILKMRVIVSRPDGGNKILLFQDNSQNIETLFQTTADGIQREVNPYVLANFYGTVEEKRCRGTESCDFSAIISMFQQILESDRHHDHKWALLGWGYYLSVLKQHDLSAEKARQATELDPKFAPAFLNWGSALTNLSRNEEAIEKYRRATELNSKNGIAFYNWGVALVDLNRNEEAIEKYRRATELDPKDGHAFNNWGDALVDLGRKEEAIEIYRRAMELAMELIGDELGSGQSN